MTDKKDPKTLTLGLKLGIKAGGSEKPQPSFSSSRSKTVVKVQVKKTRNFNQDFRNKFDKNPSEIGSPQNFKNSSVLTDKEKNFRSEALAIASRERIEEQERLKSVEAERLKLLAQLEEKKLEKQETLPEITEIADKEQATNNIKTLGENKVKFHKLDNNDSNKPQKKLKEKEEVKISPAKSKWEENRKNSKISINNLFEKDEERVRSLAAIKRARAKAKRGIIQSDKEKISRDIILPEVITVQDFANRMAERSVDVIRELMKLGIIASAHLTIDADTAEVVADIFGHTVKRVTESDIENIMIEKDDNESQMHSRPPVVTIMGHVDHGKTSLLDALRQTDIAAKEAGGITQHIGAYQITMQDGAHITFLDTPGHEAFTAMRARGAKVTDIVVLVVAADDGIKAQTIEAINHAKAASVPIIVAINKIDKPDVNTTKVKEELLIHDLVAEEYGGEVMVVEVSAKSKINLEKLEEAILLQAEILNLKANPKRNASGVVIESKIDKNRGVVASLLIQRGTLKAGDLIVAGNSYGKVRTISNDKGKILKEAVASMPVEILGLSIAPSAGEIFGVITSEKQAREITEYRIKREKDLKTTAQKKGTIDELFLRSSSKGIKELIIIIKTDVQGSLEAIANSLMKLANEEVQVKILHQAVGGINDSDISLAKASNAVILGFNVRASNLTRELADREKIDIRYYSIIYNLIDDMKLAIGGMLSPIIREQYLGSVEIRQVFNITKVGKVAGSFVTKGIIKRGAKVRLLRDNIVIHEGKLKTLRRFKDEVKEVKENFECGIAFENYEDIREKDTVEVFEIIEEKKVIA